MSIPLDVDGGLKWFNKCFTLLLNVGWFSNDLSECMKSKLVEYFVVSAVDVASGSGPNKVGNQGAGSEGSGLIVDIDDFFGGES